MKKTALVIFCISCFFITCFPLYSQTRIFVPSVEGAGSKEDNDYFLKKLNEEVKANGCTPSIFMAGTDYILKSTIVKYQEFDQTELTRGRQGSYEFVFILELIETKTTTLFGTQYIVFNNVEDGLDQMVSTVVSNILSGIDKNIYRGQKIFAGANLFWLPKMYQGDMASTYWQNFGFSITGEYYILDFLSLELGLLFSQDWISVIKNIEEYKDLLLEIPVSVKYAVKPQDNIMLSPLAGISLNLSLTGYTIPSVLSAHFGLQVGLTAGYGMIIIDPRFNLDFFESQIKSINVGYRRNSAQVGIGYKIGFPIGKPQPAARAPAPAQVPSSSAPSQQAPASEPAAPSEPRQPRERNQNNQIYFF